VSNRSDRRWGLVFDDLSRLALLAVVVMVVLSFRDYGITNDEEVQNVYGIKLLAFYTSFFEDRSAFEYLDLYRYGGLFDLSAALLNLISPLGEYETRHLLGGLVGVVGLAGAWRLGRLIGGPRAGLIALLLLLLTPAYYGHSFNNPKDAPFAAAMVWTLYYLCRALMTLPDLERRLVFKLGLALGLALSIRVGALLVGPYMVAGLMMVMISEWRANHDIVAVRRQILAISLRLAPSLVVAYAVMAVFWPWGVMKPLNPLKALHDFSTYPINLDTLVAGEWVKAAHLPRDYLPDYLLVNLPEMVLFGVVMSFLFATIWLVRRLRHGPRLLAGGGTTDRRHICAALVLLSAVFPVVFFVFDQPTAYNGIRHFLFILPPMAVLAALGIDSFWHWLTTVDVRLAKAFAAALTAAMVAQIWIMGELHPDEYVYYNLLTGGVKGAEGAYELDYWGNSLLEATNDLADFIANEYGDKPINKVFKVAVCGHPLSAAYFFPDYMEFTKKLSEADFLVAFTQGNCQRHFEGRQIISVERFGAALSVVKDRRYLKNGNK
jgi:hypothetical protein